MDSMPVEVVGLILSHVASALHVARASATCRKWRDAVKHHCHKLSFDSSDLRAFYSEEEEQDSTNDSEQEDSTDGSEQEDSTDDRMFQKRMVIITEAVLQRTCLCELSISHVDVHEAPLITWLVHTRLTLKSLTLVASRLRVNILEKLACGKVALEYLVWWFAYIPKLNPAIHSLPSLVSLTLQGKAKGLRGGKDIEVLLSLFPKLEFLSLSRLGMKSSNSKVELNIPPSLKTLHLKEIFFFGSYSTHVVLHADNLENLSLVGVGAYLMTIFAHHLECLEIRDFEVNRLEVGSLASLLNLKLNLPEVLATQILRKASTKLSKLQILRCQQFASIGDMIASLFPNLRELSLDFCKSSQKLVVFELVVALKLHTHAIGIDELVSRIVKFMECFPNLKQLTLAHKPGTFLFYDYSSFWDGFTPHLNHLMHLYPHVDVRIDS